MNQNKLKPYAFALALLLLAMMILLSPASIVTAAAPTDLFISEYIEGSSNNKALEIYNGTGAAVNLTTGGYEIFVSFNGGSSTATFPLSGTVANGDVFVFAASAANATILAQADQTTTTGLWNGDDFIALRKTGAVVVDSLGVLGTDPGTEWGTGLTSTADNTLQRKDTVCAGDTTTNDAFDPATEWNGLINDTFTGLGSHTANCGGVVDNPPTVSSTTPADNATNVSLSADISVTFNEAVTVSGAWYTISCANSGAHTATVSGGPTTFTLNPDTNFTGTELCTVTIESTLVADQDGTADNMAADFIFDFTTQTPPAACGDPGVTPIHDVQGNGASSPISGNTVTIEGIIVGDFQDFTADPPNELNGYVIQEEDGDIDADPNTSEGILVFEGANPSVDYAVGDKLRLTGTVTEFGDVAGGQLTEITSPTGIIVCSTGNTLPTAATIDLPVASLSDYEAVESMLVTFSDELTVTEVFTLGRYGEILLSAGGRLWNPTHAAAPGAPAQAVRDANILRSIVLDDGLTNQNPDPLIYPAPGGLSASNTLRGGDTTTALTGVMHFLDTTEDYRIQPTGTVTWVHANPRPADAPDVGGSLRVTAQNTLNFFTTLTTAGNVCGPLSNQECRGANSSTEFTRQRDKLLNALVEMNADVFGLVELENNASADPANDANDPVLESIVNGLNGILGAGTYDFIDTGTIGGDAIKVGLIYKPATVSPVGDYAILDSSVDPNFIDTRNRPVLAQTFEEIASGETFTVAVAHLKSKGSACGTGDDVPDVEGGNCNGTRTDAAQAIVDWFATDPTGSGDTDFLLVGDLNSYAMEDPIQVLLGAGYADLADDFNAEPYSYVFDGEWGYLDYAIASPSLAAQVNDAKEWHINSDEPIVLDYNTEFKSAGQISSFYSSDPFRISDHDPILVGLDLTTPDTTPPDVTVEQAAGQVDPTSGSPINFTVVFSEPVTGFATGDVTLSGTAGATTATVTEVAPNDGTTYNVAVSGMTANGTVIATVAANVAEDGAGNDNTASTSTDNTVTFVMPTGATEIFVSTTAAGTVGAVSFGSEDILKWDGSAWSVWFDGSAAGLTAARAMHNLNAVFIPGVGNQVLVAFTQNARFVPGIAGKVDGMDLVLWNGSAWSLVFDGQDVGLTNLTQEKIDGLHMLDTSLVPAPVQAAAGGSCLTYFLISTAGPGKVPGYTGTQIKFGGEDVLGFCATQVGATTAGKWFMVLDGSVEGMPLNSLDSISASADGQTLYLTTRAAFNVDSAVGGHSMVYKYESATGQFSGPYFSAPANGLTKKVDALHVVGDLP